MIKKILVFAMALALNASATNYVKYATQPWTSNYVDSVRSNLQSQLDGIGFDEIDPVASGALGIHSTNDTHVTGHDRLGWQLTYEGLGYHTNNTFIHVTEENKTAWNAKLEIEMDPYATIMFGDYISTNGLAGHLADTGIHVTEADKTKLAGAITNGQLGATVGGVKLTNNTASAYYGSFDYSVSLGNLSTISYRQPEGNRMFFSGWTADWASYIDRMVLEPNGDVTIPNGSLNVNGSAVFSNGLTVVGTAMMGKTLFSSDGSIYCYGESSIYAPYGFKWQYWNGSAVVNALYYVWDGTFASAFIPGGSLTVRDNISAQTITLNNTPIMTTVTNVVDAKITGRVVGLGVQFLWTGTQSEYDAIDPKSATTVYIIAN